MYVSMKGMLKRANEGNYAVMAINCFNIETARAVINAAQSLRAPIIINIVQEHMVNHCDSNLIAPIVKKLAQRASVEVALNFDHGEEIGLLKKALVDGYSSVMVDASRYNLEGNIRMTSWNLRNSSMQVSKERSDVWVLVKAIIIQTMI